jgi:aldehyde:ferredoxin oxidoreductase
MDNSLKIWRVDLHDQSLAVEPVPERWKHLGGRGILARILSDEVDPTCKPLGQDNKLVFAPGLFTGHMLSSIDRLSVGAKSPLTGGIKESNAGGRTGLQLTFLGIKALIIENAPDGPGWWILHLRPDGARFERADQLAGMGVYETANVLLKRFGDKVAIAMIGPGGEMGLSAAGIQNIDKDRVPSRINARGGIGAVMGSKRLKAIIVDAQGGQKPPIADLDRFKRAQQAFNKALAAHPVVNSFTDYGTAGMTMITNAFGSLPTRNFSSGQFEGADRISGEFMRQSLLDRGGESKTTHACMAGCTIRCSNVYGDAQGKAIVSPLEYETIGLMGSNLGIDDLDMIAHLNWQVNDLGLDSIEIGGTLGVTAEAGLMEFGDGERALKLLGEIRSGSDLGRTVGNGAGITGQVYGVKRVPVVKNQVISAYDPRAIKGTGVTYATSPQGADHTAGLTIRYKVDHLDPKIQAELSKKAQINMAGYDTIGACIFSGYGFASAPELVKEFYESRFGDEVSEDFLQVLGRETLTLERAFNNRAGFTAADDRIPKWMTTEPLPPFNPVFDVSEEDLDKIFDFIP